VMTNACSMRSPAKLRSSLKSITAAFCETTTPRAGRPISRDLGQAARELAKFAA
jgi:hypothetical protein